MRAKIRCYKLRRIVRALPGVALAAWAVGAAAHAQLERSAPAADAVISTAPPTISLWFNEAPEVAFSTVRLLDATGATLADGALQPTADNGLVLAIGRTLPPGGYEVRYRVLSVDGHVVEEGFRFEVRAAPSQ